ncbi:hypothetical protein BTH50_07765 [Lactobacillus delbrueckii subsp. bulgaricus]|nr:hypothetical protein [Lactobacillus delbrueckii subsp. bulgaricus]MBT8851406.1 hypothetical protein [Lactobacillus delbrueckii subsp. bulgaricus]
MDASLIQKILPSYPKGRQRLLSLRTSDEGFHRFRFGCLFSEIGTYKKLISDLDKSISRIVSTLPEAKVLESIPEIGKVYSAGIIAEIGSIDRFDTEA